MIKFIANLHTPNCLIGLGLSDENVKRLTAGQPILVDLLELGLPWSAKVVIFHGTTEQFMTDEFRKLGWINEKTETHFDPKLVRNPDEK
jgi:hypothetical protein